MLLENTSNFNKLYTMTGLHYEKYKDHHSIRINQQRRIEFDVDKDGNITIIQIIDVNNHYKKNF